MYNSTTKLSSSEEIQNNNNQKLHKHSETETTKLERTDREDVVVESYLKGYLACSKSPTERLNCNYVLCNNVARQRENLLIEVLEMNKPQIGNKYT